jgi:hypothetical protein
MASKTFCQVKIIRCLHNFTSDFVVAAWTLEALLEGLCICLGSLHLVYMLYLAFSCTLSVQSTCGNRCHTFAIHLPRIDQLLVYIRQQHQQYSLVQLVGHKTYPAGMVVKALM